MTNREASEPLNPKLWPYTLTGTPSTRKPATRDFHQHKGPLNVTIGFWSLSQYSGTKERKGILLAMIVPAPILEA